MELESLTCSHCGAPLEVPKSATYVTCGHCGQKLVVKRSASAAWTEQLEQLDRRTEHISEQLDQIARQNEIERIDREWEQQREQYMVRGKSGRQYVPTAAGSLIGGIGMAVFGVVWMLFASQLNGLFALFGVVFVGFALYIAFSGYSKAQEYQRAERRYRRRRAAALQRENEPDSDAVA